MAVNSEEEEAQRGPTDDAALDWRVVAEHPPADYRVFTVQRHEALHPLNGSRRTFSVVRAPDWVNVVALTPEDDLVLVRQFRHGTRARTLEIPGGMVDPRESPARAAVRELLEETGYEARAWYPLGVVEPNPAIQSNRLHTSLALDARRARATRFDAGEVIAHAQLPIAEAGARVADGTIRHALVIVGLFHLRELAGAWRRPSAARLAALPDPLAPT